MKPLNVKFFIWCSLFLLFLFSTAVIKSSYHSILVTHVGFFFFLMIVSDQKWDQKLAQEELKQAEKDNFLEWRRQLVR